MRIGLITDSIDYQAPGVSRYIRNLVTELLDINKARNLGHEFFLIHEKKINDPIYSLKGINEVIVGTLTIPFRREIRKAWQLNWAIKNLGVDLVHDLATVGPLFLDKSIGYVQTVHDIIPFLYPKFHPYISYIRLKYGLKIIRNRVNSFITVSESVAKNINDFFYIDREKISVIPLAPDPIFKKLNNKRNKQNKYGIDSDYLLFVGTIEPRKNVKAVVEIFSAVRKSYRNLKLVIVGKYGWKSRKTISLLRNTEGVIYLAQANDSELLWLYNSARLFLFMSYSEGFGLPIVEAMACGCPVLVSDIPPFREIVRRNDIIFNIDDIKGAANKVIDILKNGDYRDLLVNYGLDEIRRFSWPAVARDTIKVYDIT